MFRERKTTGRPNRSFRRTLQAEALEDRRLLAAYPYMATDFSSLGNFTAAGTVLIDTDALTINGIPGGVVEDGTAVFAFDGIDIPFGTSLVGVGSRPLALLANSTIQVDGQISVDGMDARNFSIGPFDGGPGGYAGGLGGGNPSSPGEGPGGGQPGVGISGSGGGGYGGVGGDGGSGAQVGSGGASYGDLIVNLEGGSGGAGGAGSSISFNAGGGGGGGALLLSALTSITISSTGVVSAGGGDGAVSSQGASGGGSGGGIVLFTSNITNDGIVRADGGDGGAGGCCGAGGGGGGGRILMTAHNFGTGIFSVAGGTTGLGGSGYVPGTLGTDGAVGVVTVEPTLFNAPPDAQGDSYAVDEDNVLNVMAPGVLANDTDANGDGLSVSLLATTTHGSLTLNSDGSFIYTADPDFFGSDSFTYEVSDGKGGTDTAAVEIVVNSVNDAPRFTAGADQTVDEDAGAQTVTGWATGIATGPANESGQSVSFNVSNDYNALFSVQPSIAPDGTLSFTPAPDAYGTATVTVSITDDGGTANSGVDTSASQSFVIMVNSVIDAVVDIKPGDGDEADLINLSGKGVAPIAILSTQVASGEADDFDASAVDLALITFKINGQDITPDKMTLEDVDGDGDDDLLLHFLTEDLADILSEGDTVLTLTAEFGGAAASHDLGGSDAIKTKKSKGKNN